MKRTFTNGLIKHYKKKITVNLIDYMPLLYKISYKFPEKFRNDLIQEGYIALEMASNSFDPNKGTPFETFAYKRVQGQMINYLKKENTTLSLDEHLEEGDSFIDLLKSDEDVERKIEADDYYKKRMNNSSKIESFILKRHFEMQMTASEIVDTYKELINIRDVRKIKKILK